MVRIAPMSRRRAKCIVSIAGHRSARHDVQKKQNHVQKKQISYTPITIKQSTSYQRVVR
jgi:hypothetical protein